jgi:hypothetical protein
MADELNRESLDALRAAANADPEDLGWAFALLLADRSQGLIRAGQWDTSVQLLDEAQAFLQRAEAQPRLLTVGSKSAAGTHVANPSRAMWDWLRSRFQGRTPLEPGAGGASTLVLKEAGIGALADRTLRAAVQALPPGNSLVPLAKSRLGRWLLQRDLTLTRDRTLVDEAVELCAAAVRDAAFPDSELQANLGSAHRARFGLTGDLADLDDAITSLQQALVVAGQLNQDRHAILADLGDAFLAGFTATSETSYLDHAIAAQRQALELLPADHADRPAVLSNLGAALLRRYERFADADDLAAAMGYLDSALAAGGGRRDVVRANLGSALLRHYQLTGSPADLSAAIEHLTAAAEGAPGGSAQQVSARAALAQAMSAAGQLRPARDLLSDVVLYREDAFGAEHVSTLAGRHNLATVMALLGHCQTAAGEFREVAAVRARVLGDRHPDTLASRHNLAAALADLGRTAEARTEFGEVVAARRAVLGLDHPDTRASQTALEALGPS